MTGPDVVFFDLGSVACRFLPERRLAAFSEITGLAAPEIRARIWGSGLDLDMDRGRYTLEEACRAVCDALGCAIPRETPLAAWARAWDADLEVLAIVDAVRQSRRAAMLSDNGPLLLAGLPRYFPELAPRFDPLCFSSDLAAVKPTAACFERALARAGVGPERAVLVDDVPENAAGARAYGMAGIVFTGSAELRRELRQLGIDC
jgi:glucose-1-phosphatase